MFSLDETLTWTAETAFFRLKTSLPGGWSVALEPHEKWVKIRVLDQGGVEQWAGEHVDLKILCLDILGWLRVRTHTDVHPAWRPRRDEPSFVNPFSSKASPDPADLDPEEVAAVYKPSR